MNYIICKSALNSISNSRLPYSWDLNIYRGCSHGCKYCYAIYSHKHLKGSFHKDIYIKSNIIEELDKTLRSTRWKQEVINLGGVTDNYQPVEKDEGAMSEVLKLLIKYRTPAIISTKSDLVLRDIGLIEKLSSLTYINVAFSFSSTDREKSKNLEPGAPSPYKRLEALREIKKTGASTGIHLMPIVPIFTERKDIEELFSFAKRYNIDYVLPGTMYLRGETRPNFMNFIKSDFNELYNRFVNLYLRGKLSPHYKDQVYSFIYSMERKYGVSKDYHKPMMEKVKLPEDSYYDKLLF